MSGSSFVDGVVLLWCALHGEAWFDNIEYSR